MIWADQFKEAATTHNELAVSKLQTNKINYLNIQFPFLYILVLENISPTTNLLLFLSTVLLQQLAQPLTASRRLPIQATLCNSDFLKNPKLEYLPYHEAVVCDIKLLCVCFYYLMYL